MASKQFETGDHKPQDIPSTSEEFDSNLVQQNDFSSDKQYEILDGDISEDSTGSSAYEIPLDIPESSITAEGEAKQILHLDDSNSPYSINTKELNNIFSCGRAANLPVAIYSVAGEFRKGKSFLLNLFQRYLRKITTCSDNDLNNVFEWRGGTKACTHGISIFSQPFILDSDKHGKVAVFLMDTEGIFDLRGSMAKCSKTFALSTLISSVQIFNIKHLVSENDLQHLQLFTEYGKLMQAGEKDDDQSQNSKAFQKLLFLVRDWSNETDYPCGFHGGEDYLDEEVLKEDPEGEKRDSSLIRQSMRMVFEQIQCFLMPEPSEAVRHGKATALEDIGMNFMNSLQELASNLFDPDKIVVKTISGKVMTGETLSKYFSNITFVGDDIHVETLYKSTSKAMLHVIIEESRETYNNNMSERCQKGYTPENELTEFHGNIKCQVVEGYNNKKKFGDKDLILSFKETLRRNVEKDFKKHLRVNEAEKEKQMSTLSLHLSDAKRWCENEMRRKAEEPPLWQDEWKEFVKTFPGEALKYFDESSARAPDCLKESFINELKGAVGSLLEEFRKKNFKRVQFHERKDAGVEKYQKIMSELLESNPNQTRLRKEHEDLMDVILDDFKSSKGDPLLEYQLVKGQLRKKINNLHNEISRECRIKSEKEANDLKETIKKTYKTRMDELCKNGYVGNKGLKATFSKTVDEMKKEAANQYKSHDIINQELLDNLFETLQNDCSKREEEDKKLFWPYAGKMVAAGAVVAAGAGGLAAGGAALFGVEVAAAALMGGGGVFGALGGVWKAWFK